MNILKNFLPTLLFIFIYVGSGTYFSIIGTENPFYQIPATIAIIPAIGLGWLLHKGNTEEKMYIFIDGARDVNIITMCMIFLLSGAFSAVTKTIGSVGATVDFSLALIPSKFLLLGIFIISAFISTAIGTSMGTIATMAPIAADFINQGIFEGPIAMATVVGGAMFGDSLSLISDTTIAAVMSQQADMKAKFKLNSIVATIAAIFTIIILSQYDVVSEAIQAKKELSLALITPYILLILLPLCKVNVFSSLIIAIIYTGVVGYFTQDYNILKFSQDVTKGFAEMQEITLLSLLVGGLSGFAKDNGKEIANHLARFISKADKFNNSKNKLPSKDLESDEMPSTVQKAAQLVIAKIVVIFDLLFANNTIAIIFTGEIAKDIAKKYYVPPHYSATWLDIFSVVTQGIIPYGAQILLASFTAGLSPLSIVSHVYYCYCLGIVAIIYILLVPLPKYNK